MKHNEQNFSNKNYGKTVTKLLHVSQSPCNSIMIRKVEDFLMCLSHKYSMTIPQLLHSYHMVVLRSDCELYTKFLIERK